MKVLNLDALVEKKEKRSVRIGGKDYAVEDMTVENYIQTTLAAEKLDESSSDVDQMNATIDLIVRCVPTIDRGLLAKLQLDQLRALVTFVRGGDVDEGEQEAAQAEAAVEGK